MIKHREEKLTRKGRDVAPVALRTHARRGGGGGEEGRAPARVWGAGSPRAAAPSCHLPALKGQHFGRRRRRRSALVTRAWMSPQGDRSLARLGTAA